MEQNDPQNIEAIFYSSYGKAMLSLTDSDRFKREQKFNVFGKSISVIDDYYDVSKADELEDIIKNMSDDLILMTQTSFVYNTTTQNNATSNDSAYTYVMFAKAEIQFIESVENILKKNEKVYLHYILLKHYSRCIQNKKVDFNTSQLYQQRMQATIARLAQLDPSFVPPAVPAVKSGCYVATCVYGSYDCPQVWTLRRYRDYKLDSTWYGRAFIKIYYAISPTIVKWFGETSWFKKLWKGKLDKMVAKLQAQGYEDTKYEDKQF